MTKKITLFTILILLLNTSIVTTPLFLNSQSIVYANDKTEKNSDTSQSNDEDDSEEENYFYIDIQDDYKIKTAHKEYSKNSGIYHTKNAKLTQKELDFYAGVLKHMDDFWGGKKAMGDDYIYPDMVLYKDNIEIEVFDEIYEFDGVFYLGGVIFVDIVELEEIAPEEEQKVLVLAHEMGHHIQNNLFILSDISDLEDELRESGRNIEANEWSIRLELNADYFAGVFSNYLEKKKLYTLDNLLNALETAKNTGDDVILGDDYHERESDHGTAKQRMSWFLKGNVDGEKGRWQDNFVDIFDMDFDDL